MNEVKILSLSYGNFVSLEDYEKLQQQLKQRDEVIDEVIEWVNTHDIDDVWELLEILQQYKGDNK